LEWSIITETISKDYLLEQLNSIIEDCEKDEPVSEVMLNSFRVCKTLIEDAPTTDEFIDGNRFFPQDGQKVIIFTGRDYVIAEYDKTFGRYLQRFSDDYDEERTITYDIWNIRWWKPLVELKEDNYV
jgi:hypothetical protein